MKRVALALLLILLMASSCRAYDDKGAHFFAGLLIGSLTDQEIFAAGCAGALKEATDAEWDNGDLSATLAGGIEAWVLKKGSDEQLYWSFVILEAAQAGNMNWQQNHGYYEINPLYGDHPDRNRVYLTKGLECLAARLIGWGLDEPQRSTFLRWCHYGVLAMMAYDTHQSIPIFNADF